MEATGFPRDDELYKLTCAAHEAVNGLRMKAHYLSCSGTGCSSGRTAHRRLQAWERLGVWNNLDADFVAVVAADQPAGPKRRRYRQRLHPNIRRR
jgi:hypothetical protein